MKPDDPTPRQHGGRGKIRRPHGSIGGVGLTLRRRCFDTAALNAVYYTVHPAGRRFGIVPFVIGALLAETVVWKLFPEVRKSFQLLPAWLWWGLLTLPADFMNLAAWSWYLQNRAYVGCSNAPTRRR